MVARQAHILKVVGSSPASATNSTYGFATVDRDRAYQKEIVGRAGDGRIGFPLYLSGLFGTSGGLFIGISFQGS